MQAENPPGNSYGMECRNPQNGPDKRPLGLIPRQFITMYLVCEPGSLPVKTIGHSRPLRVPDGKVRPNRKQVQEKVISDSADQFPLAAEEERDAGEDGDHRAGLRHDQVLASRIRTALDDVGVGAVVVEVGGQGGKVGIRQ